MPKRRVNVRKHTRKLPTGKVVPVKKHNREIEKAKKKHIVYPKPKSGKLKYTECNKCGVVLRDVSKCPFCSSEDLKELSYKEFRSKDETKRFIGIKDIDSEKYIIQQKPEDMHYLMTFKEIHGDKYKMSGFGRTKEESMVWVKEKRRIGRKAYLVPVYDKVGSGYAFYAEKAFD